MAKQAGSSIAARPRNLRTIFWRQRWLFLMSVPFLVWLIIFKYVPLWGSAQAAHRL